MTYRCNCPRDGCHYVLIDGDLVVHMDRSWTPLEDDIEHDEKGRHHA